MSDRGITDCINFVLLPTVRSVFDLGSSVALGSQALKISCLVAINVFYLKINELECSCSLCVRVATVIAVVSCLVTAVHTFAIGLVEAERLKMSTRRK